MRYCSNCGQAVGLRIPDNDNRERYVCDHCDTIHYQNPRVVVGCLPVHGERVLLCRRAIQPRHGFWTLPAGFLENGETALEGALRETWEEARARVRDEAIYTMFDLPHIHQIYVFYRGVLDPPEYAAGPESLDVQLFHEHEIPWDELAFPVVSATLRYFFEDRKSGHYPVRNEAMRRTPRPAPARGEPS
jgi:ADP-ribose pyrophosphatase YjhB (NUDIX family)